MSGGRCELGIRRRRCSGAMVDCACRVSDASGSIEYSEMKTGAIRRSDLDSNVRIIYTVYLLLLLILHHPSLFQSRLKTLLFCKSFPPQPFIFLFRTDYMDSPLLIVTSEHIRFYFLVFLFYTF